MFSIRIEVVPGRLVDPEGLELEAIKRRKTKFGSSYYTTLATWYAEARDNVREGYLEEAETLFTRVVDDHPEQVEKPA